MSIKIMSEVWDSTLQGAELLIMLVLADHANDHGMCWPSYNTIARKTKISRRHTIRIVRKFEDSGLLRIRRARIDGEINATNVYEIVVSKLHKGSDTMSLGSDTMSLGVVTSSVTRGGDIAMSPKPPIESSSSTDDDDDGRKAPNSNGHALTDPDPVTVQIRQQLHKAGVIINPMIIERYRDLVVEDGIAVETVLDGIAKATGYGKQHNYNYVYKIVLGLHTGNGQKPQQTTEQPQLDFSIGDIE